MSRQAPPALFLWLLAHTPLDPFVAGDIIEQYSQGRSVWWLWRQVFAGVVIRFVEKFFAGSDAMKRMTASMLVLLGVFLFGFWAGRSPLLMSVDPPPRLDEIPRPRAKPRVLLTAEFLQLQLDKARTQNAREKTTESKQRVEDLEYKLSQALQHTKDERK